MLSLGLYILAGHNTELPYKEIWGGEHLPSYNHYFSFDVATVSQEYKKHILLLRDYWSLHSSTPSIHSDGTEVKVGTYGLNINGYVMQIRKFDSLQQPKIVVYFEDLLTSLKAYEDVAKFVEIKYDPKKIDLESLKQFTKQLYVASGHRPSGKNTKTSRLQVANETRLALEQHAALFDKYLGRYEKKDN